MFSDCVSVISQSEDRVTDSPGLTYTPIPQRTWHHAREYPKASGLAAWSENCKLYGSLPLCAVV